MEGVLLSSCPQGWDPAGQAVLGLQPSSFHVTSPRLALVASLEGKGLHSHRENRTEGPSPLLLATECVVIGVEKNRAAGPRNGKDRQPQLGGLTKFKMHSDAAAWLPSCGLAPHLLSVVPRTNENTPS